MQQLLLDIQPKAAPTFDNFVVANANQAAYDAVKQLKKGQTIYIWGESGSGRSHLLQAKSANTNSYYLNSETSLHIYQQLAHDESIPINIIAADDIDQLDEQRLAALFTIFNRWRDAANTGHNFILLCSGSYAPINLNIREDIRTRLGWGLVFRLESLTDDECSLALRERATELGLSLSNDVLNWILTHYNRDMRSLTALLKALDVYSLEKHRAITIPLLKDLLQEPRRNT